MPAARLLALLPSMLSCAFLLLPFAGSAAALATVQPLESGVAYAIEDHRDGPLTRSSTALRLDALNGDPGDAFGFSAEQGGAALQILWNEAAGQLTISGTVFGGQTLHGDDVWMEGGQLFAVEMRYDRILDGDDVLLAVPGTGRGSITALGRNGQGGIDGFAIGQSFVLTDRADRTGYSLSVGFGPRLGDRFPVMGEGTLAHDANASLQPTRAWSFAVGDPRPARSVPVPEPGTALLLGAGLALLARRR